MHTSSGDDYTIPLSQFSITSPGLSVPPSENLLPTDTDMLISAGATFDMNNASQTLRTLQGDAGSSLVLGNGQTNVLTINGAYGSTQFDGVISGQGNLVKAGTSELVLGGVSNFDGAIDLQAGTLTLTRDASITGLSDVDNQSGATLVLELSHAGDLNMLGMSGNFAADGTLRIVWAAGALTPQNGDTYDLFDFATLTGDFATLELPTLASGFVWDTSNLLTTGVISIEGTSLVGDLDGDGFVGLSDLDIILTNWNTSKPDDHPADPSGDNYVGLDDLDIVLSNWNAGTPSSDNANIPEPTTIVVLGVCGTCLIGRRR